MRWIPVLIVALTLTACDNFNLGDEKTSGAVDPSSLAPLSSREQSLIFAADGAMQQGNYAAAERDYLGAIANSKGHIDAHLALARLYQKQRQPTKEREILERALELQPNHPLANYFLGRLHLNANEYSAALSAFQRGRASRPDDVDLTIGEAVTHDMLGNHSAAQQLYVGALRNHPTGIALTNLAMSYILSEQPQKAVDLLRTEATKSDASPVTRHNLALAYGLLGRHGDAKEILKGDIDEETRLLTIARMKSYYVEHAANRSAAPSIPSITPAAAPEETGSVGPAPVIKYPSKSSAPAPAAEPEPAAEKAPEPAAEDHHSADAPEPNESGDEVHQLYDGLSPAAGGEASYDLRSDPNYIPGLEQVH